MLGEPEAAPQQSPIEARRRFTNRVLLIAGVAFFAQMALGFLAGLGAGGTMMYRMFTSKGLHDFDNARFGQAKIHYVARSLRGKRALVALSPHASTEPEELAELPGPHSYSDPPQLVVDATSVWVFEATGIKRYQHGRLKSLGASPPPVGASPPFLFRGSPAVLVESTGVGTPQGVIWHLSAGGWKKARSFGLGAHALGLSDYQVVPKNAALHLFAESHLGEIYYARLDASASDVSWEAVTPTDIEWSPLVVDQSPTVVRCESRGRGSNLVLFERGKAGWAQTGTHSVDSCFDFAAMEIDRQPACIYGSMGGEGVRIVRFPAAGPGVVTSHGGGMASLSWELIAMILFTTVLTLGTSLASALMISRRIEGYRNPSYRHEASTGRLASLARRAAARGIDSVFSVAPLWLMWVPLYQDGALFAKPGPGFLTSMLGYFAAALGLWALITVAFSILEGKWGVSPGKWLLGLRVVGLDLKPCGIPRALLRNVVLIADQVMNYLVGVVCIALTEKRQRVGDLAARTLVIDIRPTNDSPSLAVGTGD